MDRTGNNIKKVAKQLNEERAQLGAKKQLMRHMQTKIKTTMIGALASFEENFGYLWGHGLPSDQLTESQRDLRELWEDVRTEILDKGNTQSRGAMDEISQYTLSWNKFHMDLVVKPNRDNPNNQKLRGDGRND